MERPSPSPRAKDDSYPSGGLSIEQEINAIRWERLVKRQVGTFLVIVRYYENGDTGLSVRNI